MSSRAGGNQLFDKRGLQRSLLSGAGPGRSRGAPLTLSFLPLPCSAWEVGRTASRFLHQTRRSWEELVKSSILFKDGLVCLVCPPGGRGVIAGDTLPEEVEVQSLVGHLQLTMEGASKNADDRPSSSVLLNQCRNPKSVSFSFL